MVYRARDIPTSSKVKRWWIVTALVLAAWGSPVEAAVSVHPARLEFRLGVDGVVEQAITVRNSGAQVVILQSEAVALSDVSPLVKNENVDWLQPSASLTLAPNETAILAVKAQDRPKLSPGGHYAAVKLTEIGEAGQALTANPALLVPVFAVKEGGETVSLTLDAWQVERRLAGAPQRIAVSWRATGNTHVVPRGVVTLRDKQGVIWQKVLNESSGYIFPGQSRTFAVDPLPKLSGWKMRQLTLTLDSRPDGAAESDRVVRHFWYIPSGWWWGAGAVVLAVLIVLRRRSGDK